MMNYFVFHTMSDEIYEFEAIFMNPLISRFYAQAQAPAGGSGRGVRSCGAQPRCGYKMLEYICLRCVAPPAFERLIAD